MLAPLLIGVISQAFGLTVGFVVCGLLSLAALSVLASRQHKLATPQPTSE